MQRYFERRTGQHRVDPAQIRDRLTRIGTRLIADRKGRYAAQPGMRLLLAKRCRRRSLEPVRPTAPRLGKPLFERCIVDRGYLAAGSADDELDARQGRIVEVSVECRQLSGERFGEDRGEALAECRVIALARYIDEAGDEAFERIAANEQRDALSFPEIEDPDDRLEQLVFRGLEQLVARQGVQNVQQRLAVVACRRQPGALDNVADLEPQQRDRVRAAAVGERGKQPEKQVDADHLAARRKPAQSDRIHRRGSMNGGAAVRFGDYQELPAAQEVLHVGRQPRQIAKTSENRVSLITQDPERAMGRFGHAVKQILAIAEKGEIVVVEPAQEILDLGEFRRRHRWQRRAR